MSPTDLLYVSVFDHRTLTSGPIIVHLRHSGFLLCSDNTYPEETPTSCSVDTIKKDVVPATVLRNMKSSSSCKASNQNNTLSTVFRNYFFGGMFFLFVCLFFLNGWRQKCEIKPKTVVEMYSDSWVKILIQQNKNPPLQVKVLHLIFI